MNISNRHKHLPEDVAIKLDKYINLMNKISLECEESIEKGDFKGADMSIYDINILDIEYKNIRSKYDIKYKKALELLDVVNNEINNNIHGDKYKAIINMLKGLGYTQKTICHESMINPCLLSQHMRGKQVLSNSNKNKLVDYAYKIAIEVLYAI